MKEKIPDKKTILETCLKQIDQSIRTNSKILASISESMIGETKSSAGDKFETSRAMLQADQNRYKGLIIKAKETKQKLSIISLEPSAHIREGSLVITTGVNYFIAVGIGKILVPEMIYVISKDSPIGKLLIGKQIDETISFNKNRFKILAVY